MILSTLTKKLAEIKGEECNLWKFPKRENQEFFPSHCQQVSKRENMRTAQLQNHSLWYDRSKSHALFALQIISSSFPESKARKEDTSNSQAGAPQSMLQGCLSWWDLLPSPGIEMRIQACLQWLYQPGLGWHNCSESGSQASPGQALHWQPRALTREMLRKH